MRSEPRRWRSEALGGLLLKRGSVLSSVQKMVVEEVGTRSDRRKARTVQSIFDAAEGKFLEHGFHGTTVEEIAQAADVSVGSIYVHFQSKEGLYLALLERALEVEERYM